MKITGKQLSSIGQALMWLLFTGGGFMFYSVFYSWQKALLLASFQIALSMALFYGNIFFVNFLIEKKHYQVYALVFVLISLAAILLRTQLNGLFSASVFTAQSPIFNPTIRLWSFAALTTVPLLILSLFYQVLRNRYRNEQHYLSLINQHSEAQLQFLKAQINPHFLFNTLNNIYSLALTKSPHTPKMILLLSDLLRYVIYESQHRDVQLTKEIFYLQKFIDLFQMRNEEPLDIRFQQQGELVNWHIEPMILIPLVENCFKHCDFETNDKAFVRVELYASPEKLIFSTLNSKNELHQQKDSTGGVGLENISKRLQLQYEGNHQLEIHDQELTFSVRLSLTAS